MSRTIRTLFLIPQSSRITSLARPLMNRPKFPLFGPLADSRKRQSALEDQLRQFDAKTNPEEHARITGLIQLEEDIRASFSDFLKEQTAQRRSVSAKGLLQVVALSILVFIALGLKRHFFG
ncbi:hypothetical protein [Acidovorax sp. ST3]|uniref:hypothetical protein n=1 Tax=Acidovorax sp. ST3 TaxID=2219062 RepID=UPI00128FE6E4|nr:hypothetical protein [Acidovorax sp. ST3]